MHRPNSSARRRRARTALLTVRLLSSARPAAALALRTTFLNRLSDAASAALRRWTPPPRTTSWTGARASTRPPPAPTKRRPSRPPACARRGSAAFTTPSRHGRLEALLVRVMGRAPTASASAYKSIVLPLRAALRAATRRRAAPLARARALLVIRRVIVQRPKQAANGREGARPVNHALARGRYSQHASARR